MNRQVFLGLVFIVLGAGCILVTTGYLNLDWEAVAKLWPLALVLFGLALLTRQEIFYPLAVFAFIFALFGIVGQGVGWVRDYSNAPDVSQVLDSKVAIPVSATFNLEAGAGRYEITDGDTELLQAITNSKHGSFTLKTEAADTAQPQVTLAQDDNFLLGPVHNQATIALNRETVWDLNLEVGAAQLNYDFSNLAIRKVVVKSGAVSGTITFGTKASQSEALLEIGASSLTVRVPKEVGVLVKFSSGLTSRKLNGFVQNGDQYQSEGYDSSTKKLDLTIEAGASSITVERY